MPPAQSDGPSAASLVQPAWKRGGTVYIVGLDGLSPAVAEPMMERGELPNLRRIAEEGCRGPMQTVRPTSSPLVWTTIATGRPSSEHGIEGFTFYRFLGRQVQRTARTRLKRLGLRPLLKLADALRLYRKEVVDGRGVRVKRFWEILGEGAMRSVVVNWWNSWPAEPMNGLLVSDRVHYWRVASRFDKVVKQEALAFPDTLMDGILPLVRPPEAVTPDEMRPFLTTTDAEFEEFLKMPYTRRSVQGGLRYLLACDQSQRSIFDFCMSQAPAPDVAAVYFRAPDMLAHSAFQYMAGSDKMPVSDRDRRWFASVVPQAYRYADESLGGVMKRLRPGDTLLVMSDHGFGFQEQDGLYGHRFGTPPGMLFLWGGEFQRGRRIEGATVYDPLPILLRVCGFPQAQDMPGRCPEELLADDFRSAHPPLAPIKSYGDHVPGGSYQLSGDVNKELQQHLKGLGYLD